MVTARPERGEGSNTEETLVSIVIDKINDAWQTIQQGGIVGKIIIGIGYLLSEVKWLLILAIIFIIYHRKKKK